MGNLQSVTGPNAGTYVGAHNCASRLLAGWDWVERVTGERKREKPHGLALSRILSPGTIRTISRRLARPLERREYWKLPSRGCDPSRSRAGERPTTRRSNFARSVGIPRATIVPSVRNGLVSLITVALACIFMQAPAWAMPAGTPAQRPELVFLEGDTIIGATAPPGWTNLIVKSMPRLVSGDMEGLPAQAKTTAILFRTAILADVRRSVAGKGPYHLSRIGLGLCVPVKGHDRVATSSGSSEARASLGLIDRQVLSVAEGELQKGRVLASTPSFTLFGAPAVQQFGTKHVAVVVLYGILVDPENGSLTTAVWSIRHEAPARSSPSSLNVLPLALVYDCDLDVQTERWLGTIPIGWSFAMRSLPPGRPKAITKQLQPWFQSPRRIESETAAFESLLRKFLTRQP
jgi:hypothetical protein